MGDWWARLRRWRTTLSPNCREMCRLSSEALEHDLPFARKLGSWLHLRLCRSCRRYRWQLRWWRQAVRRFGPEVVPRHPLSPAARAKLKQSLREPSSD